MQRYADIGNDSGVSSFAIGDSYIDVWFKNGSRSYRYSYRSAGQYHVENMKRLAMAGDGLQSYINSNVKKDFER